jgi:pyrroloquinoline-quinone synthase
MEVDMTLWDRLDEQRNRRDVLRHPFYLRWSAGELTRDELGVYAGQYRHAVVGLARAAANAAEMAGPADAAELREHAREEAEHIALWDSFASAVGGDPHAAPLAQTAICAQTWAGERRPLPETLAAMYVIESAQPAIAEAKRAGLGEHYGVSDREATAYFDVHVERDLDHAAAGRALIEARLGSCDEDAMVAAAAAVLDASWLLLDGVQGS